MTAPASRTWTTERGRVYAHRDAFLKTSSFTLPGCFLGFYAFGILIWPNNNISSSPRFSWNSRRVPFPFPKSYLRSRFRSRANLSWFYPTKSTGGAMLNCSCEMLWKLVWGCMGSGTLTCSLEHRVLIFHPHLGFELKLTWPLPLSHDFRNIGLHVEAMFVYNFFV